MNKRYGRHIAILLFLVLGMLVGAASLVAVVDPFFLYHKPLQGLYYTIDNQLSQNPGIARNFDYDSVILGSSMTVNFDTALFAEKMGLNTVKLSYNAAFPKDNDNILKLVKQEGGEIKEIFLGIDIYNYGMSPGLTAYPIPEYLYDDSLINDVKYLLNKDVILQYILMPQFKRESTPLNEIYWFWENVPCGKEIVLASYQRPEKIEEMLPRDFYRENIEENMRSYILPYVESMPETQFTVFFPPYSILYWYDMYGDGTLSAELAGEKQIIEQLLSYPNVRIFYFQNDLEFITDLNNYSDYTHYRHEMNDQMTEWFSKEDCPYRLTEENYEQVLDEMEEWLLQCDFDLFLD